MSHETAIPFSLSQSSQRARWHVIALLVAVLFWMIGRLSNDNPTWVQVDLPMGAASVLMLTISAVETMFYVQRLRARQQELVASRTREHELAQQLAVHRHSILNQISRALIDKLDYNQISADVLEKVAQLFEADVAAIWVGDKNTDGNFMLKGSFGLQAHSTNQLDKIPWAF